jgi:hypothetical protein
MAFQEPKKWSTWLPLAEWWYNTTYHTFPKCSPFEVLYSYPLSLIFEIMVPSLDSPDVEFLTKNNI